MKFVLPVNCKLELTKSFANDWTTKTFAICLYGDWTLCCYSCWPSATPEGVQGGVRHSVLQGIWWDSSLDQFSSVAQSCPTLCNPKDCSLPGSSVHGIFQARVLEWVAISFSRDLPNPGIKPGSPALQADVLLSEPPGKTSNYWKKEAANVIINMMQRHLKSKIDTENLSISIFKI